MTWDCKIQMKLQEGKLVNDQWSWNMLRLILTDVLNI
jgi:hypothetical protein